MMSSAQSYHVDIIPLDADFQISDNNEILSDIPVDDRNTDHDPRKDCEIDGADTSDKGKAEGTGSEPML